MVIAGAVDALVIISSCVRSASRSNAANAFVLLGSRRCETAARLSTASGWDRYCAGKWTSRRSSRLAMWQLDVGKNALRLIVGHGSTLGVCAVQECKGL